MVCGTDNTIRRNHHNVLFHLGDSTMEIHSSLTFDHVLNAAKDSMFGMGTTGFCLACGSDQEGCEPDMESGKCETCEERKVMGAANLMIMLGE